MYTRKLPTPFGIVHKTCRIIFGIVHKTCRIIFGIVHKTCRIIFGFVHKTCRIIFGTKCKRNKDKYGLIPEDNELSVDESSANDNVNIPDVLTRSKVTKRPSKRYCFICDEVRDVDNEPYVGGLGRCSTENGSLRLKERQKAFLENYNLRFYDAASRLQILMGGNSHDIFSADIFYHQSCYIKFTIKKVDDTSPDEETNKNKEDDILEIFLQRIKSRIVREKSAYLLNELLIDINLISEEQGLEVAPITNTRPLKRLIVEKFGENVSFFPNGKYLIVHA